MMEIYIIDFPNNQAALRHLTKKMGYQQSQEDSNVVAEPFTEELRNCYKVDVAVKAKAKQTYERIL